MTPWPTIPRAARRSRPDHSVEFPDPDGYVEAGAGDRRGQLRGAQAGRADTGQHPGMGGTGWRSAASGRAEHRQRLWPEAGQAAGVEFARRQDRLHGRNHYRSPHHAIRQPEPDPGNAGTGRQVTQIFFADVCQEDDEFFDKAIEGSSMFALNQGEVCTCPSRALIQESIYDSSWSGR